MTNDKQLLRNSSSKKKRTQGELLEEISYKLTVVIDQLDNILNYKPPVQDDNVEEEYSEDFEGVGKSTYVDGVSEVEVVPFGNGWLMFYTANSGLFAATSDDGVSWKKIGSLDLKITDVTIISLGSARTSDAQYKIYGEEEKVSGEVDREEVNTVGKNWISSFTLTVS